MQIITLQFNNFAVNTYIVYDTHTRQCAIIDPGMMTPREEHALAKVIEENHLKPVHLINTHMHIDHVMGNAFAAHHYGLRLSAHKDDEILGSRVKAQAQMFGLPSSPEEVPITTYLEAGDIIKIGEGELKVLHVPGHSPGSIALYDAADGFVITGDALFSGSVGRTDLPGGSGPQLIKSIRTNLLTLPPATVVYPGHGPATTIAAEMSGNPFLM